MKMLDKKKTINICTKLSAPMVIHPTDQTFTMEPQVSALWWWITKSIRIHPLGSINVHTKICANLLCRCREISLTCWRLYTNLNN